MLETKFVMKQVFTDVKNKQIGKIYFGRKETHFNIPWRIYIRKDNEKEVSFYLKCLLTSSNNWSFEVESLLKIENKTFSKLNFMNPSSNMMKLADEVKIKESNYENLSVEVHVRVKTKQENVEKKPRPPRQFSLKHVFTDVMKLDQCSFGKTGRHFNIPWRIYIYRTPSGADIHLECLKTSFCQSKWQIQTNFQLKFATKNQKILTKSHSHRFGNLRKLKTIYGPIKLTKKELKEFLDKNGNLTVECHVEIVKMRGIRKIKRRFDDETARELSDVVMIVQDQKFYVLKKYLACHSIYLNAEFKPYFNSPPGIEFEVFDTDPYDFQQFLELIYGESNVDESNLEGVLYLATMLNSKIAIQKCEEFLVENSKRSLKIKLQLALDYELEKLKKKCIFEIKTLSDIRHVLPKNPRHFGAELWAELLNMSLNLK